MTNVFNGYVFSKTGYANRTIKRHRKTVVLICGVVGRYFSYFLPFLKYSFS